MTDHEIENKWNEMIDGQAPKLWKRIESRLDEQEQFEMQARPVMQEQAPKEGFFQKLKNFTFGGGAMRTAAALTCLAIVCTAVGGGLFGSMRMGSSAAFSSAKGADSYVSAPLTSGSTSYGSMEEAKEAAAAENGMASQENAELEYKTESGSTGSTGQVPEQSGRKLIRDVSIDVETLEFDSLIEKIKAQTSQAGGYIESSSINGGSYSGSFYNLRYAYLTLRIPADQTDAFLEALEGESNVVRRSEGLTDVTLQYVDMESHLKALRAEEEQLLKLMERADTTEDLILIQSELTQVRYQIESCQSQINTYDNLIDYDTINLSVDEVRQESLTGEPTVLERIKDGLVSNTVDLINGIGNLIVWLITMIPVFVVLFVVILAVVSVIRKIRTSKKSKK